MVELKDLVGAKVIEGSDDYLLLEKDGLRYQVTSTGIKRTGGPITWGRLA